MPAYERFRINTAKNKTRKEKASAVRADRSETQNHHRVSGWHVNVQFASPYRLALEPK
jgi:hypothetical protein